MKSVKHKNINQRVQPVWIHNRIHLRMAPKERDYVTLATFQELLKVQESIRFKSLFQSMIQTLTLRVDSVVKDVQDLQYTKKDVKELKPLHVKLEDV